MHSDLAKAAKLVGAELPALKKASKNSQKLLNDYKEFLDKKFSKDPPEGLEETDVVLLGSIAREEGSSRSDCDYYVLQKGAPSNTTRKLIMAME